MSLVLALFKSSHNSVCDIFTGEFIYVTYIIGDLEVLQFFLFSVIVG